ncbi:MAG: CotH kinase family protein [Pseudomonadales bacterium]|nr:CotH kinase family protein [Pseudomonadales bacterium]
MDEVPDDDLPIIVITEASSLNSAFEDEDGDTPDWFELFNTTDSTIQLIGWSVTDDIEEPSKWTFPDIEIKANSYLRFWASGKNNNIHTNFKLSSEGEVLTLFDTVGVLVDRISVEGLRVDTSVGRSPKDWKVMYFDSPTPGSENITKGFNGIIRDKVIFSHDGGIFNEESVGLIGADDGNIIRYTLDSTVPNDNSMAYSSPISVDANTVIRAGLFKENFIPSIPATRPFIVSNTHDIPIVTLVTESQNFFDEHIGIYHEENVFKDWERDIHFSFYEPTGELGVAIDAGVKIFGGFTRTFPQKSMSIFARGRYSFKDIEYPIFPSLNYEKFQAIVLRNSGNDWMYANMRDAMATSLMTGSDLEFQAFRSVAVYLNGQYWGFYNIREKINEHFLDDKIDVQKNNINLLELNGIVIEGENQDYLSLIDLRKLTA